MQVVVLSCIVLRRDQLMLCIETLYDGEVILFGYIIIVNILLFKTRSSFQLNFGALQL